MNMHNCFVVFISRKTTCKTLNCGCRKQTSKTLSNNAAMNDPAIAIITAARSKRRIDCTQVQVDSIIACKCQQVDSIVQVKRY